MLKFEFHPQNEVSFPYESFLFQNITTSGVLFDSHFMVSAYLSSGFCGSITAGDLV